MFYPYQQIASTEIAIKAKIVYVQDVEPSIIWVSATGLVFPLVQCNLQALDYETGINKYNCKKHAVNQLHMQMRLLNIAPGRTSGWLVTEESWLVAPSKI